MTGRHFLRREQPRQVRGSRWADAEFAVDTEKKIITITVKIVIWGEDATSELASLYQENIEAEWDKGWKTTKTDTYDSYDVKFEISVEVGEKPSKYDSKGATNYIEAKTGHNRSGVIGRFRGTWRTTPREGTSFIDGTDNMPAHEFGHLLGFQDRYTDVDGKSVLHPDWKDNIMGNSVSGSVEQRNIDAIASYILRSGNANGILIGTSVNF